MDGNRNKELMRLSLAILLLASFQNSTQSSDEEIQESSKTNEPSISRQSAYTLEEKRFICAKLESFGNPRVFSTWKKIAQAMKIKYDSGTLGFRSERKARSLRQFFYQSMMKKDIDIIPDSVKRMLQETSLEYSEQEDDLIINHLSSHSSTKLHSMKLWQDLKTEHDLKVDANAEGFKLKKSEDAFRVRYYQSLEPHGRVPQAILDKYGRIPTNKPGHHGGVSYRSKRKHSSLSSEEELQEGNTEFIDFFGKELENAPELDESDDKDFDIGDDEDDDNELTKLKLWNNPDDDEHDHNELPKLNLSGNGDDDEDDDNELTKLKL